MKIFGLCESLAFIFNLIFLAEFCALSELEPGFDTPAISASHLVYTLFTGEVTVNFTFGSHDASLKDLFEIQLVSVVDSILLSTFPISSNSSSGGEVSIACGEINSAPQTVFFQLAKTSTKEVLAISHKLDTRWPQVTLKPQDNRNHYLALTENVVINVIIEDWISLSCPWNESLEWYPLSLEFQRSVDPSGISTVPRTQSVQTVYLLRLFDRPEHSVTFSCRLIDQQGRYRVVLKSPDPANHSTIAMSDFFEVNWKNDSYQLSAIVSTIFPCLDDIVVTFSRPRCATGEDRIRLYRRQENVAVASDIKFFYVAERRVRKSTNQVEFPCSLFEDMAPVYCWKYVSVAHSGAIYEHNTLCRPATTAVRPVDGGWSDWSEWSDCSATCLSGSQVRFRSCDQPPPSNGGAFCDGVMTESRPCDVICPELFSSTTLNSDLRKPNSSCDCGCRLTESTGTVVSTPGCPSVTQWIIEAASGEMIRLRFLVFDLEDDGLVNVKVRDGSSLSANLLLNSYGSPPPAEILSSSNVMMIEFRAPVNYSGGFVAAFSTESHNVSEIASNSTSNDSFPLWKSVVIATGVIVCGCVIIIATLVVCCDVMKSRRTVRRKRSSTVGHQEREIEKGVIGKRRADFRGKSDGAAIPAETVRIYPSAKLDDITPSMFLATSSPYLNPRIQGLGLGKRHKARTVSHQNVETFLPGCVCGEAEYAETGLPIVGIPVDLPPPPPPPPPPPLSSLPNSRDLTSRKRSRTEGGKVKHHRRSRSHGKSKSLHPAPTSTFEEDLLMLERQNEVLESGVASTRTSDTIDSPRQAKNKILHRGLSTDRHREKNSRGDKDRYKSIRAVETIPLKSYDESRSRLKSCTPSNAPVVSKTKNKDRVKVGYSGVAFGQRPPVEGSYDSEVDPGYGMPQINRNVGPWLQSMKHQHSPKQVLTIISPNPDKKSPKKRSKSETKKFSKSSQYVEDLSPCSLSGKGTAPQSHSPLIGQVHRSDPVGHAGQSHQTLNKSANNSSNSFTSTNVKLNSLRPNQVTVNSMDICRLKPEFVVSRSSSSPSKSTEPIANSPKFALKVEESSQMGTNDQSNHFETTQN